MGDRVYFSKAWDVFRRSKASPAIFICAGIKVLLLFFFFWAGTVFSSTTFSFPLKQWSVSCHWLHSRSSVRDSMSSSWDWTLFCHTSNKRLYFPVPASEKIHRVSWSSSSVMQITTSVVSSSGDKCCVKPGSMHPPAVCLNGFVSAVTVSVCAGK